jgi:glutathione gamma-glutamylcysteinyltransferase
LTQKGPPTCGPSTLTMILNSLKQDPGKSWKGVWRWWSEDMLEGLSSEMLENGISLHQFTKLARQNGTSFLEFYYADSPK